MTRKEVMEMMRRMVEFAREEKLAQYRDGMNFSIGVIASSFYKGDSEKAQKMLDELRKGTAE